MATIPTTEFLTYVTPYAPGVPEPTALFSIRSACEDFCRMTHCIQARDEPRLILDTDTVVGDFDTDYFDGITVNGQLVYPYIRNGDAFKYTLAAETGMRPHEPQNVRVKIAGADQSDREYRIFPITVDALDRPYFDYTQRVTDIPRYYTRLPDEVVDIYPLVPDAMTIKVRTSYIPLPDADEVDRRLFVNWKSYIAAGVLSKLYNTPDQPYTDPAAAQRMFAKWRIGVTKARIEVNTGRTQAELMPTPKPFDGGLRSWAL